MSSPNPQTPQPPRCSSMQLKCKVKEGSGSPAPKQMKQADDSKDPGHFPSKEAPLHLTYSKSRMITSSKSPSKAGLSLGAGSSNAGPCHCTAKDQQEVLMEACNHLTIFCKREDLDWSLLFAMQGLYRPLQHRIQAWEAKPIPNTVIEGRFSRATELSEESN
ncbi:hypothetical protein BT96DRAFT_1003538 [Gymnopus androsaceus JB14]|uniref:Uncharacterized protein n=1 Tax=Gymnopus androsaceus JB14 TaxID=1447944 RepID=A0A6A4GTR9_9AGAR|nr:hypothetical protein BT96DRAFT_1003538 [Gymnopus androsaceus JB14]